jgi:hypothetical protein
MVVLETEAKPFQTVVEDVVEPRPMTNEPEFWRKYIRY